MGKAYAHRRAQNNINDLYDTPYCLTELLISTGELNNYKTVLEPCAGNFAISKILEKHNFVVTSRDIIFGNDFLKDSYRNEKYDCVVTNPPFNKWNEIVKKAKSIDCHKVCVIGRTNYFASHSRTMSGIWSNLSDVYIFDRQIAYDKPLRDDGLAYVGCLVTGWFIFKKGYLTLPKLHILDCDKYIYRKAVGK